MKKTLLTLAIGFLSFSSFSQVVFSVESPVTITYGLTYANENGADWGSPDLLDPANVVIDTIALARDLSPTADSLMCEAATANSLNGKIAMLYRGDCQFGLKAKMAQNAGAVAVIIVNNVAGEPIGMAAGDSGVNVTIPVVMISQQDGAAIRAMMGDGIPVVVFIGNKTGYYPNDLGTNRSKILIPRQMAIPAALATNGTEFNFKTGAWVHNYGYNNLGGVKLEAKVSYNDNILYTEESAPVSISAGDSTYITFANLFSEASYQPGEYKLVYTITSDSTDSYNADNIIETRFNLTEDLFSLARLDANGLPSNEGGSRPTATPFSFFSQCVVFRNTNASRLGAQGMYFSASKNATDGDMEGEQIDVTASKWNNVFNTLSDILPANLTQADIDNALSVQEEITSGTYIYQSALADTMLYVPFQTPFGLEDNQRYLFCVTSSTELVFLGYERTTKYDAVEAEDDQPTQTIVASGSNSFGFQGGDVPTIGLRTFPIAELGVANIKQIEAAAFPNPANSDITVRVKGYKGAASLTVTDVAGKVVAANDVTIAADGSFNMNVSELNNGMYIFNLVYADGNNSKFNVVVSK